MREKHFLKLRGAIAGKGYTIGALAQELNITQQSLHEKLRGKTQFTLEEMLKACNFLDAQMDIFFDPQLHDLRFLENCRA